jgi:GNAT superfamily N-acetyltransferase
VAAEIDARTPLTSTSCRWHPPEGPPAGGILRARRWTHPALMLFKSPPTLRNSVTRLHGWTDDRVWDAVDAWRWIPPSAKRLVTPEYELAVTPGSYSLTYVYGFHVESGLPVEERLAALRYQIASLGGTGARIQVTPKSRPENLVEYLTRAGYKPGEEAEALFCAFADSAGKLCLPDFRPVDGISVREANSESEYKAYLGLTSSIFGDPPLSVESQKAFIDAFHQRIQETGHSDRYVAWEAGTPVGIAGLEIADRVARLFGSGVLPTHRGRGVYGQLVRARCEEAADRGAEIGLVTARVGTSGPILKHHGFRSVGSLRIYEARW